MDEKIELKELHRRLSVAMHWNVPEDRWNTLLYGWRVKYKIRKRVTDRGWLSVYHVRLLSEYAMYDLR